MRPEYGQIILNSSFLRNSFKLIFVEIYYKYNRMIVYKVYKEKTVPRAKYQCTGTGGERDKLHNSIGAAMFPLSHGLEAYKRDFPFDPHMIHRYSRGGAGVSRRA